MLALIEVVAGENQASQRVESLDSQLGLAVQLFKQQVEVIHAGSVQADRNCHHDDPNEHVAADLLGPAQGACKHVTGYDLSSDDNNGAENQSTGEVAHDLGPDVEEFFHLRFSCLLIKFSFMIEMSFV